ncbi:MAG: Uma2 family endonuclease [Leptospiraceae bacterium]|nr:Uma2 family endonuclease [Leptospiraceae bacterium]
MLPEVLEISDLRDHIVLLSISDYEYLCKHEPEKYENTELYRGFVIEKMTKSSKHNYYKNILTEEIRKLTPKEFFVQNENSILLNDSDLEPDISIIYGKQKDYKNSKPRTAKLVVEISFSSLSYDRSKSQIYAKAMIPEFWILDIESEVLEVYSNPTPEGFQNKSILDKSNVVSIFGKTIQLAEIFA